MRCRTRRHQRTRRSAAFSLVEMLVVIVVIGVITKISLTAIQGVLERADRQTREVLRDPLLVLHLRVVALKLRQLEDIRPERWQPIREFAF